MYRFYLVTLFLLAASCSKMSSDDPSTGVAPSFYYWQSELRNFDWNDSTFKALNVEKIYYRFFDVDWSDQAQAAVPVSPLDVVTYYRSKPLGPVVPVVFITNETFKNLSESQSVDLARQVHRKVVGQMVGFLMGRIDYDLYPNESIRDPYRTRTRNFDEQKKYDSIYYFTMKTFREVQFDCDWTKSTRNNYFAFLNAARKLFKDQLVSSTIRLYQYKYPNEAGVPPVARGMLMCYNAGDVRDVQTKNSIFDKKEIMSYLTESPYPLPLDYALPVFDWALLYKEGEFKSILSTSVLKDQYQTYLDYKDPAHALVTDDFVYGNTKNSLYIRRGDEIRFEEPSMEDVQEVAAWLSDHKNNKEAILSIYHLNNHDLKEHSKAIEAIFNSF